MKKLMFTAIVLVAFSNLSMANTVGDEEITKTIEKKQTLLLKRNPCIERAMDALEVISAFSPELNDVQLHDIYQQLIAHC